MKKYKSFIIFALILIIGIYILNLFYSNKLQGKQILSKEDLKLPNGYSAKVILKGLKDPTIFTQDKEGNFYIAENINETGRIIKYTPEGKYSVFVDNLKAPIKGLIINKDKMYISHKGKISVYDDSTLKDIITGLPSIGDYSNNGIAFGYDGRLYICQGSATNSGIVGIDNYEKGWLKKEPYFHDYSPKDVSLNGTNYKTKNPLTDDEYDRAGTGPFLPFNTQSQANDIIKGRVPGNASIMRIFPDGGSLENFAWGIRNPINMIVLSDGSILTSNQGMENRGSRPIANGKDNIYQIKKGIWYGWPDYENGEPVTLRKYKAKGYTQPEFITEMHPTTSVTKPLISFNESGRIGIMDICKKSEFGFKGELFIPLKQGEKEIARIVLYDLKDNKTMDFIKNNEGRNYLQNPVQCYFSKQGKLYILENYRGALIEVQKEEEKNISLLPKYIPTEYVLGFIGIVIVVYLIFVLRK